MRERWTQRQVDEMIKLHGLWLRGKEGGERAKIIGVDLSGLSLTGAHLRRAQMRDVKLADVNISVVDFSDVEFLRVTIEHADARYSTFSDTIWKNCTLRDSVLDESSFYYAYFKSSELYDNQFRKVNLCSADALYTCLGGNDFRGALFDNKSEKLKELNKQIKGYSESHEDISSVNDEYISITDLSDEKRGLLKEYLEQLRKY